MFKPNWNGLIQNVRTTLIKNGPEILTGVGIAGMISTVFLAVKATPKALDTIKQHSGYTHNGMPHSPTTKEKVKLCWKYYIPAAATGTLSIACLVGATTVNGRRSAALATAYSLSETALKEYRDKVVETVGEKQEHAIRDEVAKEKLAEHPINTKEIIITNGGNVLHYDNISGRYFQSDRETLRKAENEINRRLRDEMYISLNEFYDEIGLAHIGVGGDLGWNIEKGYLELFFSTQFAGDGKTPCVVLDYSVIPEYNYQ